MTLDDMPQDNTVLAAADLAGRAGATGFEVGFIHNDVPSSEAGWYAAAFYQGARTIGKGDSPADAAYVLALRLLDGGYCKCGQRVVVKDSGDGCRWRLDGKTWKDGCAAESVYVQKSERGDPAAMRRAIRRATT